MKYLLRLLFILSICLNSCGNRSRISEGFKEANMAFGDSYFKTSIMLIELHKKRYGEYPNSLSDIKFVGQWDMNAFQNVTYKKLGSGYQLDLVSGLTPATMPDSLIYPEEFWKGLGCIRSNLKK